MRAALNLTDCRAHLHRSAARANLRRTLQAARHLALAAALLATALILAHATLQTLLALPDLAAQGAVNSSW